MADDRIPFSPPRIDEVTIQAVTDVLRSGWITSGPQLRAFEAEVSGYVHDRAVICLNAWTNACELVLRWFGVGPGDEVILPAYTYAATANIVIHVGATPVLVDVVPGTCHIDIKAMERAITSKTKVIMPVDIGGMPVDYDGIMAVLKDKSDVFVPSNDVQKLLGRVLFLADAAHSFGAKYKDEMVGAQADVTGYSFHAVKNLTTAEGGALAFNLPAPFDNYGVRNRMRISSLHGQTKDAFSKTVGGSWRYDVIEAGFKCNMTDLQAAIGLVELKRYDETLGWRKRTCELYNRLFADIPEVETPVFENTNSESSYHLYMLRVNNCSEEQRDAIIDRIQEKGVAVNVHFQPLPLLSFYKDLGYKMDDYPNAFAYYQNEISLPVWFGLADHQVTRIVRNVVDSIRETLK
ncbi:MAG: aminotransferase class I/II-fold pyridoxal phosphate-dependent enzyme [Cryomorphaceae bacterium]|nr:aminotransferase class I/II-fold pyridoxal phosphate-dependent enzyme [Cryomorphaceae bacterium]